jgi:pyrimidine-specific ribonucleoside hydrolase
VASAGNAALDDVVANTSAVLGLLGWEGPFAVGDGVPITGEVRGFAPYVHGTDGLLGRRGLLLPGPAPDRDGVALLRDDVLATGPLTTVARALAAHAEINRIVWMGGNLRAGNITKHAEFNAWWDPAAVDAVCTSGIPLRIVPLDLTQQVRIQPADVERLRAGGPAAAFFGELEGDSHKQSGRAALHDPVAVLATVEPERFEWRRMAVRCDLDGETAGRTIAIDDPTSSVEVAVGADPDSLRQRVVELLLSLPAAP